MPLLLESKIDGLFDQLQFQQPLDGSEVNKLIPLKNLSVENTIYWRALVVYVQKTDALEDRYTDVICDLSEFCDYVKR